MKYISTLLEYVNKFDDNFWKWFKESKMVNRDNLPKVYYNGSNKKFNNFDKTKLSKKYTNNILGFYFSNDVKIAEMYGKYIKECYLSIQNPKLLHDMDFQIHLNYTDIEDLIKYKKELIREGYDGIVYDGNIVVAFEPNQIKSVHNDGSYDINDDNIYS